MKPFFSVIIPVFNTEKYLPESIGSVLKTDSRKVSYEIVVVDDGSSDNSGAVCDVFQKQYPDIVRCFHQQNKGVSCARNAAIREAVGEYIVLLDSDDMLAPHALENLAICIGKDLPDIVVNESDVFIDGTSDTSPYNRNMTKDDRLYQCGKEYEKILKQKDFMLTAWAFSVKRELLIRHGIVFLEGIVHEDELWSHEICIRAETLKYNEQPFYCYRTKRANSIMAVKGIRHLQDYIIGLQYLLDLSNKLDEKKKDLTIRKAAEIYWSIVYSAKDYLDTELGSSLLNVIEENKWLLPYCKFDAAKLVSVCFSLIGTKNTEKMIALVKRKQKQ